MKKIFAAILISIILLPAVCLATDKGVYFHSPKDGAKVSSPVKIYMGVTGMKVMPAGKLVEGTGHHHLIIDGGPIPEGEVVPANNKHIHFGKGQTQTEIELFPGKHRLTLQFADGVHRSYGPDMSKTIEIMVTQDKKRTF